MKKIYVLIATCTIGLELIAQPTILGTDFNAQVGENFNYVTTNWLSPGNGGANQTWNLSALTVVGNNNAAYSAPSGSYPGTTVTRTESSGGVLFEALNTSGQTIYAMQASGVTIDYSDPMTMLQYPLTMGSIGDDTHEASFVSGGFPFTRIGTSSWEVDGYGTVITPNGTFSNVIRVHQTQVYTDIYDFGTIDYNVDIYSWIKAGVHWPIASLTSLVTSQGSSEYGTYYSGPADLGEQEELSFALFPNPAEDELHILTATSSVHQVIISDLSGKVVTRQSPTQNTINLRDMQAGIYLVQIEMEDGTVSAAQRLVKQ